MSRNPLTRKQATVIHLAGLLIISAIAIGDFYWMRTNTHLPLRGEVLILLPVTFVLGLMWMSWRLATNKVEISPPLFGWPLVVIAGCLAYYVSQHTAKYLVLICLYGFARVQSDHLYFTSTEKMVPWVVSNGDHVAEAEYIWSQVDGAIMATVFFVTVLLIYPLLPKRDAQQAA
jgi:hypothetical protein